jgi:hypothetical protein
MDKAGISQSEFELVDFLRDLFPRVAFGIPKLGRDEANWKLTYVALYGLNEVAEYFDDRVELEIKTFDDRVFYESHTRCAKLTSTYNDIIAIVDDGEIEDIIEGRALPSSANCNKANHSRNLEAIDMLLQFDANDINGLPDELLDAEDIILFGSTFDHVMTETDSYLYEVTMPHGIRQGEILRPRKGIEISRIKVV